MLFYCLKCKKNIECTNPKVVKSKNRTFMFLSKCTVCNSKKLKFIKDQKARGLLSNLTGIKVSILNDLPYQILSFKSIKWIK